MLVETCSRYQYLSSGKDTIYNSILVIVGDLSMNFVTDCHIHGLEGHQLRSDSRHCRLTQWAGADTNRCTWLAEVFTPLNSMSATKTQSSPPSFGPPGTIFELDCNYYLCVFYENINWESHDCMQKEPSVLACDIANPFPPYLWGYVHGFGYHNGQYWMYGKSLSAGLLRLRAWIWPLSGRFGSTAYILGLIEIMANLSTPDLVRFWA